MPDFKTFIKNRPELQELSVEEQQFEYDNYIADVMESIAD